MGWTFSWSTRRELINHLIRPENGTYRYETIRHCTRGNVLWCVTRVQGPKYPDGKTFIGCFLLQNGGNADGWGYKDMDESMHPCYYSCPITYLDLAPETCPSWRAKVRTLHKRQSVPLKTGQTIHLRGCVIPKVRLIQLKPLRGIYDGKTYALTRPFIAKRAVFDEDGVLAS